MKKLPQNQAGITFIELLLVVAIMLSLSVMSGGLYSRFFTQNAVANATDQLAGQLRKAQTYALSGKQNGNWGVNYGANTLTLYLGNSYATRTTAFDESFTVPNSVTVTGISDINFARVTGLPSTTATMNITGTSGTHALTLNSQGVVSR